jgi:hypothetical protein
MRASNGAPRGHSMVAISKDTKNIYILSFLEFFGRSASQDFADRAKAQIEKMWGNKLANVNGENYKVNVQVETSVRGVGDAATPGYDQVSVDPANGRPNQALFGDGVGQQVPNAADANNYVAAHEYGHSLGLQDEYHDTPAGSVPNDPSKVNNIMAQTWPGANGTPPGPYSDQYDNILHNYGLP